MPHPRPERKGETTVLAITRGFRGALCIAYQIRPCLFDRQIMLPEWRSSRVIEIDERIAANGEVVQLLNGAVARKVFQRAFG